MVDTTAQERVTAALKIIDAGRDDITVADSEEIKSLVNIMRGTREGWTQPTEKGLNALESVARGVDEARQSRLEAEARAKEILGPAAQLRGADLEGVEVGEVIAVTKAHVVQRAGPDSAVIHKIGDLQQTPEVGQVRTFNYDADDRGWFANAEVREPTAKELSLSSHAKQPGMDFYVAGERYADATKAMLAQNPAPDWAVGMQQEAFGVLSAHSRNSAASAVYIALDGPSHVEDKVLNRKVIAQLDSDFDRAEGITPEQRQRIETAVKETPAVVDGIEWPKVRVVINGENEFSWVPAESFGAALPGIKPGDRVLLGENEKGAVVTARLVTAPAQKLASDQSLETGSREGLIAKAKRLIGMGAKVAEPSPNGRYTGNVIAHAERHTAQDVGGRTAVIHNNASLDKVPQEGSKVTVQYSRGQGRVIDRSQGKEQARDIGQGR